MTHVEWNVVAYCPRQEELPADESPGLSPYARVTNTGVDPKVAAARRAQADWDAAAEIGPGEDSVTVKVPPAVVSTWIGSPFFCHNAAEMVYRRAVA